MFEVKEWNGKDLKGDWLFTWKIDGIRAHNQPHGVFSRNGSRLYNLPPLNQRPEWEIAEVFCGSWGETWSIVSASKSERRLVDFGEIFTLFPKIDSRLAVCTVKDPFASTIKRFLELAIKLGHEGLVLRKSIKGIETGDMIKVKKVLTVDAVITGLRKSQAKSHKGLLKEFETNMGRVGLGLTKKQRKDYLDPSLIGTYIEVKCMGITPKGKWREPRFIRLRPDK